jgi:pSer/pThr/pTyr-binding forkhead associated (FHA) protein
VLALIYLFFLRVLRAVWVEVHGPRRARVAASVALPAAPPATGVPGRPAAASAVVPPEPVLRVLEPVALAGRTVAVAGELTFGRAPGCDVQLDDTYVSQVHARVALTADGVLVDDCNSTNGTYVNSAKVHGPTVLRPGDRLQLGNVVMELA